MIDEDEIFERLNSGDDSAYKYFYKRVLPSFIPFVKKYGGNKEDAEDIFQDAILILLDIIRYKKINIKNKIIAYLFAICKKLWYKKYNKSYNKIKNDENNEDFKREKIIIPFDENLVKFIDKPNEIDEGMQEQINKIKEECISLLTENCRKHIDLFYMERLEDSQIAVIMDLSNTDVVKNMRCRCMNKLRECAINKLKLQ